MIIAHQNVHFLSQGLDLLARLDRHYATPGPHGQASAGAHMRHVLDCYQCFLRGIDGDGRVDYDARDRDVRVETETEYAATVIHGLIERLEGLHDDDLVRPLRVQVDAAAWDQGDALWTHSSVARELQFLLSHTVHHYALIALIARAQGVDPGKDLGVAPSTLEYRRRQTPAASAVVDTVAGA